jgi:hypothetical protein
MVAMTTLHRASIVVLTLFVAVLAFADSTLATVVTVPGDYSTIQEGIDAAASGDTVRVSAGTYTGAGNRDLDFSGKSIVLLADGPVTIDCQGAGVGFRFHRGETAAAVVDGFTIANGNAAKGGGISVTGQSGPTIRNCTVINCTAAQQGGGIFISDGASPAFTDCEIVDNAADHGGGVFISDDHATQFIGSTISGNTATRGGGVATTDTTRATFTDCTISGNEADDGGGVISADGSAPAFELCAVTGNKAINGGGFMLMNDSAPVIIGCTVAGNYSLENGAGLYVAAVPAPIVQTIVWGNCADITGDELYMFGGSSVSFVCSDVDSSGVDGAASYDAHTVFDNPLYCDAAFCTNAPTTSGEYTLDDNSPALATNNGCGNLIGAFPEGCVGRSFDVVDDDVESYGKIQDAIDQSVGGVGDTVAVSPGTWSGVRNTELDFRGKNIVLKAKGGPAVIDGGGNVRAIVFQNGEDNTSLVEGFVLRGGVPGVPGATVLVKGGSSPVFRNCKIKESSGDGGIVRVESGNPLFEGCTFEDNSESSQNGVLALVGGNPKLVSSFVRNNVASVAVKVSTPAEIVASEIVDNSGCGVYFQSIATSVVESSEISRNGDRGVILSNSFASFVGVTFQQNAGGGVKVSDFAPGSAAARTGGPANASATASTTNEFINCEFSGHSADRGAGFFFDCANEPEITYQVTFSGCQFSGNAATFEGGAVAICGLATNADILPVFDNCTIAGNSARDGGGIYMGVSQVGLGRTALATVDRSIVWGNCSTVDPKGEAFVLAGNELSIGCSHTTVEEIAGTGAVGVAEVTTGTPNFCDYPGSYYDAGCVPEVTITGDFNLSPNSPAAPSNHPCGPDRIGAYPVVACIASSANEPIAAMKTAIHPPVPNPFNPTTTVEFTLESRTDVMLSIYDVKGRLVRTLENRSMAAGVYNAQWDGRDDRGAAVASGIYFIRMNAGARVLTQKMVLIK